MFRWQTSAIYMMTIMLLAGFEGGANEYPHPEGRPWEGIEILVVSPTPTHPQDHGNRKRIFELCSELKGQGAKIHFVHYASEHDWRHDRPTELGKRDDLGVGHLSADCPFPVPARGCRGGDHRIDEWADPALSSYIRWTCSIRAYDIVLVEYTWMSFCFESVPKSVFKICDTHDVFGGRRHLLAEHGIDPEFFYTTPDEEKVGLERADLIWAIKDSERTYFKSELKIKDCLTLLYSEPARGWWAGRPSQDGWLRVGIIGARNSVNRRNLEAFIATALPVFETYMAPVKIVIAGGCSDDFAHLKHPNIEILGRVPDVADFYRGMDVIAAPMQFSTGLKIKVAEALASGAPLIAHAHAMEGYPTTNPLHQLPDFKSIALGAGEDGVRSNRTAGTGRGIGGNHAKDPVARDSNPGAHATAIRRDGRPCDGGGRAAGGIRQA